MPADFFINVKGVVLNGDCAVLAFVFFVFLKENKRKETTLINNSIPVCLRTYRFILNIHGLVLKETISSCSQSSLSRLACEASNP